MVVPLRLPPGRFVFLISTFVVLGGFFARVSTWPSLVKPRGDLIANEIGRTLMSVPLIGGVWPLPAALALAFLAAATFFLWGLVARRPFEMRIDERELSWPSFLPWKDPHVLPFHELHGVESSPAGDLLVLNSARGRLVMPAWWLPQGTSLQKIIETISAAKTNAQI